MLRFVLYFSVGMTAGLQVAPRAAYVILGGGISPLEIAALIGPGLYLLAAFVSPSAPFSSVRISAVGSVFLWAYYVPALFAVFRNIAIHGSDYPLTLFLPVVVLVAANIHSFVGWKRREQLAEVQATSEPAGAIIRGTVVILVAVGSYLEMWWGLGPRCIDPWEPRRTIVFRMVQEPVFADNNFRRTLRYAGSNEDCLASFSSSEKLARYIDSFGSSPVPVTVEAFGDPPLRGTILSVGTRSWRDLGENERMVYRRSRPGVYGPIVTCLQR
jgi:hypothetical protein